MRIDVNEIMSLKLSSGEEIIAKVVKVSNEYIELSNPLSISPNPQGVGLIPTVFTADKDKPVRVYLNCIAISAPADKEIQNKYIENTTGIVMSSGNIVV